MRRRDEAEEEDSKAGTWSDDEAEFEQVVTDAGLLTPAMYEAREAVKSGRLHEAHQNPYAKKNKKGKSAPVRESERVSLPKLPDRVVTLFSDHAKEPKKPYEFEKKTLKLVCRNPRIYTIDNFLSADEVKGLLSIVEKKKKAHKFQDSVVDLPGVGQAVDPDRTSKFVWLDPSDQENADDGRLIADIQNRAAHIAGRTETQATQFMETLQVVWYTDGAEFRTHHDLGVPDERLQTVLSFDKPGDPRRICTFFVYLNTVGDGDGQTQFPAAVPRLNVDPKAGMAVFWSNVRVDDKVHQSPDPRVVHKACPVPKGKEKFGVNLWLLDRLTA